MLFFFVKLESQFLYCATLRFLSFNEGTTGCIFLFPLFYPHWNDRKDIQCPPSCCFFLDLHFFLKIMLVCKFRLKFIHLQLCLVQLSRMISHFITVQL